MGLKKYVYRLMRARGFNGYHIGPFIFILPEVTDKMKKRLTAHEQAHVWQFWRTLGMQPLLSMLSKRVRLASEVEAYKAQVKAGENVVFCARMISTKYGLKITQEQALKLLLED